MAAPLGRVRVTRQPLIAAPPAVTLTFATKPPGQELPTLKFAVQVLVPPGLLGRGVVGGRVVGGAVVGGAVVGGVVVGGAVVGRVVVGGTVVGPVVGGALVGGVPLAPVSTTTDSAGIVTEAPE